MKLAVAVATILLAGCTLPSPPLVPLPSPELPAGARELVARKVSDKFRVRASAWSDAAATGLRGRVRDDAGSAAPGATLIAVPGNATNTQTAISDDRGEFAIDAAPGAQVVTLYIFDFSAALDVVVPASGGTVVDIVVDLAHAPGEI